MLHLKTMKLVEGGRILSSDLHSLLPSPSAAEITCVLHWGISVPGTLTMPWGYKLGTLQKREKNFPSLQPHDKNFVIFSCPLGCSHLIALHLWSWQSVSGSVLHSETTGESLWLKMHNFWHFFSCQVCFQPDQVSKSVLPLHWLVPGWRNAAQEKEWADGKDRRAPSRWQCWATWTRSISADISNPHGCVPV